MNVTSKAAQGDDPDPHGAALVAAYPRARQLAMRIAGDRGEDLAQDAWLRLFIVRYRYAATDLPKILTVAVHRTWLDWKRHETLLTMQPIPDAWLSGTGTEDDGLVPDALQYHASPERIVVLADERARVRALVLSMSETDREALICHYWHETTQRGVGPAFKSRVQRARKHFREQWLTAA